MGADLCNEKLPPSERALASMELLEKILLRLDLRSLLTSAQSVNRRWRQLIKNSSKIQRALFFQPEQKRRGANEPMFNPLLMEKFPSLFPQNGGTSSIFSFTSLDMVQPPEKLAAYARNEASWRKMLVQQPPLSGFSFMYSEKSMGGDTLEQYSLKVSTTCLRLIGQRPTDFAQGNGNYFNCQKKGLRVDTVFEYLLFSPRMSFRDYSSAIIGWSTEDFREPRPMRWSAVGDCRSGLSFETTMKRFRLVIFNTRTIQCVVGADSGDNEEIILRRRIADAFVEGSMGLSPNSTQNAELMKNEERTKRLEGEISYAVVQLARCFTARRRS